MRVRIDVTAEDIERGEPCSNGNCPVALAAARAFGGQCRVSNTRLERPDGGRAALPSGAGEFVRRFDRREEVSPFSFDLEV